MRFLFENFPDRAGDLSCHAPAHLAHRTIDRPLSNGASLDGIDVAQDSSGLVER